MNDELAPSKLSTQLLSFCSISQTFPPILRSYLDLVLGPTQRTPSQLVLNSTQNSRGIHVQSDLYQNIRNTELLCNLKIKKEGRNNPYIILDLDDMLVQNSEMHIGVTSEAGNTIISN